MSLNSNIEWCDATWNAVRGCTKVSPGCSRCYAETFAERWRGVPGHAYEQGFDLRLVPEKLTEPLSWKKPRRVFVNSMSDLFQDGVPDDFIDQVFAAMALCPQHTFQVLTKRAARMLRWSKRNSTGGHIFHVAQQIDQAKYGARSGAWPLPNVWLGVSVENQHFADERIPLLLQTPAAVRFISAEPLLGPVNLASWIGVSDERARTDERRGASIATGSARPPAISAGCLGTGSGVADERRRDSREGRPMAVDGGADRGDEWDSFGRLSGAAISRNLLDWVIVGGESGHGARPLDVQWARSIVYQCRIAGVPCFVKQLGAKPVGWWSNSLGPSIGKLQSSKGGDMAEWPADLKVREFPAAVRA